LCGEVLNDRFAGITNERYGEDNSDSTCNRYANGAGEGFGMVAHGGP